ncbi:MAG: Hsp33 family molecular chaperone HslO, partial [Deltaproteobacteria bacterium]|nr:Hsp33 family molecular chaperone HslO [Deltaproteobacteria bacterium]
MSDILLRGLIPEGNIRFAVCQASDVCGEAFRRHKPDALSGWLLSEALTCAVLLGVTLKDQEKITLRWMYDGPAGELMVDATAQGRVRGFPQRLRLLDQAVTLETALGKGGRIAAITSIPQKVLHTGITSAVFQDVPRDLAHLLSLSFQVESALAVGLIIPAVEPPRPVSTLGLLLQPMPGADLDTFERLRNTVEHPEFRAWMEQHPRQPEEVLARAVNGHKVQVLESLIPVFACECSTEKVLNVLRMLDPM